MIANATRDAQVALYNYAQGGIETALGNVIVMHEAGPGGTPPVFRCAGTGPGRRWRRGWPGCTRAARR